VKGPVVPRTARFHFLRLNRFLTRYAPNTNSLLIALSFAVGVGSGLGALAFEFLIHNFEAVVNHQVWRFPFGSWSLPIGQIVFLVAGGLLGGISVATWAKGSKGHGVPDVMASVAIRGGRIPPRVAGDTALTAAVCIGAGGSAGPEGPIVQIGSAIGSAIGQVTRMSTERLRILAACGAAGGISAIFGAPLAGVMFAVEVILGDFGVQTLTPIVIASVLAAVTHQFFVAWKPLFPITHHGFIHIQEVPSMVILGALAAVVSVGFIRLLVATEDAFRRLHLPPALKPALGMLGVGVIAMAFPQVLGDGYQTIRDALHGNLTLEILAALIVAKLLATCFTVGAGNVGGLFAPSLVIGAMLGGAFGSVTATLFRPGEPGIVAVYSLVGMGAVIAGTTHATITAILLIFEITNDYAIVLPAMLAVATATVLSSKLHRSSIYTVTLERMGIRLNRGVEENVMGSLRVGHVMREPRRTIPYSMHFSRLMDVIETSVDTTFPVLSPEGRVVGMLSYQDIRTVLSQGRDPEMDSLIVAGDIATPEPVVVTRNQSLNDAMRLFGVRDLSMLPVVDSDGEMRLLGVLYRRDVLNAYRRALLERQVPDLDAERRPG